MTRAETSASTWAPLRYGVFRALWLASLVSNIGTWMQTVGAQWLLVHQPHTALLVALVQTADTLPDLPFSLVGGSSPIRSIGAGSSSSSRGVWP